MRKLIVILVMMALSYGAQMYMYTHNLIHLYVSTILSALLLLVLKLVRRNEIREKSS
ncbi:MAG: hypothetical protein LM567_04415 [Desulfurococcaceae archaeon]|jgi:hypothetical protein|nr:hypothetical protein [Desulfurococcaceae archaeon]